MICPEHTGKYPDNEQCDDPGHREDGPALKNFIICELCGGNICAICGYEEWWQVL